VGADGLYLRKTVPVFEIKVNNTWLQGQYYSWNNGYYSVTTGNSVSGVQGTRNSVQSDALVYVNGQGGEVGIGWPTSSSTGGQFTTMGCWNSLLIKP